MSVEGAITHRDVKLRHSKHYDQAVFARRATGHSGQHRGESAPCTHLYNTALSPVTAKPLTQSSKQQANSSITTTYIKLFLPDYSTVCVFLENFGS